MNPGELKGLSLLVVEDEPLLRRQLAAQLTKAGAEVAAADSLGAARQCLKDGQFDLALLDVNLPDGLGTDLLREQAFPAATAVIVMTANGAVAGAVEAMRLGAADYLVKPFDAGELPLVIARAQRTRNRARLDEQQRGDTAQAAAVFFFGRTHFYSSTESLGRETGSGGGDPIHRRGPTVAEARADRDTSGCR